MRPARAVLALAYARFCAAAAWFTLTWCGAILLVDSLPIGQPHGWLADGLRLDLLAPRSAGSNPTEPAIALVVDVGLMLLFAMQHSGMARPCFKRAWSRYFPNLLERSTYNLVSATALAALLAFWIPLPGVVWSFDSLAGVAAFLMLLIGGCVVAGAAALTLESADLSGVPQVRAYVDDRQYHEPPFQVPRVYRLVRHPMWLGAIVVVWAAPRMSTTRLVLALAVTFYSFLGAWLTERDLLARFGEAYRDYQRQTPMLIPWPRPSARR